MKKLLLLFVGVLFGCLDHTANAFTCQESGIFANTDSSDCKTFVTCNSILQVSVHNCEENTYFWPAKKGCFSQYNCALMAMPGNADPCEGIDYQDLLDQSSEDCSAYIQCNKAWAYNNGDNFNYPQVTNRQCPSGSAFRPGYGCSSGYECGKMYHTCTSEGLFESMISDCSTFVQCWKYNVYSSNGMMSFYYSDLIACPNNTKFNPFLKKCDQFYKCDDKNDNRNECSEYNLANPLVPNPFDSDSSSYLLCQHDFPGLGGGIKEAIVKKECPANTLFSALLGKCYNNYDPNETCSKDPCSSGPGKYVNYDSGHCQSYIECRDETTVFEIYQPTYEIRYCPPGTRYSPITRDCNRQYVCPMFPVNYCYPPIPTTTSTTTTTSAP